MCAHANDGLRVSEADLQRKFFTRAIDEQHLYPRFGVYFSAHRDRVFPQEAWSLPRNYRGFLILHARLNGNVHY